MFHILICDTEEGRICFNVDNDADLERIKASGIFVRELSANEIRQYGMEGYEAFVSDSNTTLNDDGSITFVPPELVRETAEQIQARYTQAAQKALDAFAQTRGYDGILSACSYYMSTDSQFEAEADYCMKLRDATWRKAYEILDKVKAGEMPVPTIDEFLSMLPVAEASWENV